MSLSSILAGLATNLYTETGVDGDITVYVQDAIFDRLVSEVDVNTVKFADIPGYPNVRRAVWLRLWSQYGIVKVKPKREGP